MHDALCVCLHIIPLPRMFICVVNNPKQIKKWNATFLLQYNFLFYCCSSCWSPFNNNNNHSRHTTVVKKRQTESHQREATVSFTWRNSIIHHHYHPEVTSSGHNVKREQTVSHSIERKLIVHRIIHSPQSPHSLSSSTSPTNHNNSSPQDPHARDNHLEFFTNNFRLSSSRNSPIISLVFPRIRSQYALEYNPPVMPGFLTKDEGHSWNDAHSFTRCFFVGAR